MYMDKRISTPKVRSSVDLSNQIVPPIIQMSSESARTGTRSRSNMRRLSLAKKSAGHSETSPMRKRRESSPGMRRISRVGSAVTLNSVRSYLEVPGTNVPPPTRPKSAWDEFVTLIKILQDIQPDFSLRDQRGYRYSPDFTHILKDLDYHSLMQNDYQSTVLSSAADLESIQDELESHFEGSQEDDRRSLMTFDNASIIQEDEESHMLNLGGDMTRIAEVTSDAEEQEDSYRAPFIAVHNTTSDPIETRHKLYTRYLDEPDEWTCGLRKYFKKVQSRDRVTSTGMLIPSRIALRPKSATSLPFSKPLQTIQEDASGKAAHQRTMRGAGGPGDHPKITISKARIPAQRSLSVHAMSRNRKESLVRVVKRPKTSNGLVDIIPR